MANKLGNNIYKLVCLFVGLAGFYLTGCNSEGKPGSGENQQQTYAPVQQDVTGSPVERMQEYTTSADYVSFSGEGLDKWQQEVPEIRDISIKSTADGREEPALFYAPDSPGEKPLLVVLHSWSSSYLQHTNIPYAKWAKQHEWVFICPNYRGRYDRPEATASDLAIQDVVDAVNYAKEHANVDESRIYLIGSSGGAMTALSLAGRHPDIWAGVVAWVPIYDLVEWYQYNLERPNVSYDEEIAASCGGAPVAGSDAAEECTRRSPSTHLSNARGLPVFIAHGINDQLVLPSHSIKAFNVLAHQQDRFPDEDMQHIANRHELPPAISASNDNAYFGEDDPAVVYTRASNNARLVLFDGEHNMVYNPGLMWLSEQRK
ncbi:S9 family peptidase [Cesiribacter sp. SM1]|uniref:alpha/beta hydrolase family protein n=1 Tax=Cesiribacter sp. SM1 TaxID=2861196 RepID=UPI001CD7018D|nr:prolyl oligopeptidase family serine peptidase [Cesiribacter sp. SM1]